MDSNKSKDKRKDVSLSDEDEITYIVEKIISRKKFGSQYKYYVKWEGFPDEQNTWEPLENLENVSYMVKEFNKTLKDSTVNEISINESLNKRNSRALKRDSQPSPPEKKPPSNNSNKKEETVNTKRKPVASEETKIPLPIKKLRTTTEEPEPVPVLSDVGKYECGDKVKTILSAKKGEEGLMFLVEWHERINHTIPFKSYVSNKDVKRYDPDMLIEFYETKITFKGGDNTKTSQASENSEQI